MCPAGISADSKETLLRLARESILAASNGSPLPQLDIGNLPPGLRRPAACFVTLSVGKELRGCTGVLVARMPLAQEVIQTAAQTALNDPRFFPVSPQEVPSLTIEISILTPPTKLTFHSPEELINQIRPGIDGVTLYRRHHRATFLPQVWEKITDPIEFLSALSQKMGLHPRAWAEPGTEAEVYRVEEFSDRH